MNRRNWLRNAAGLLIAAPMVVRAESLMRVRQVPPWLLAPRLDVRDRFISDLWTSETVRRFEHGVVRDFHRFDFYTTPLSRPE